MISNKSLFSSLLALALGGPVAAQVNITAQVPPEGVLMKAQLWNVALISVAEAPVSVTVMMRLIDSKTSQPVLTGVTRNIALTKGTRQLKAADVSPIQYEYLTAVGDRTPNGLLPAGTYQACYSVFVQNSHNGDLISEDCVPFSVSPVGPPLLNTPADQSILETYNPQFSWLPPSPVSIFGDLNYELLLTEVRPGQSAVEAVQQNLPVYHLPSTKNLFANYPSSTMSLDTGKLYAWTVIAKNGNAFAAQTDVWTFKLKSDIVKQEKQENTYIQLKKDLDGSVAAITGTVHFNYTNAVNDSEVFYDLMALESGNKILTSGQLKVIPGDNMISLDIKRKWDLQSGKSYLLRVKNSRNEYFQVKFIYSK